MALSDYNTTASSNGNVLTGIDIAENCLPGNLNNALRQVMADLAADLARANGSQEGLATGASFALPRGFIGAWSGSLSAIPDGWAICDGTNSTPDLTDRFVVATGTKYTAIGATGGQDSVTLAEANIPQHDHNVSASATTAEHTHTVTSSGTVGIRKTSYGITTSAVTSTGPYKFYEEGGSTSVSLSIAVGAVTDPNPAIAITTSEDTYGSATPTAIDNRPAYYALAFIMKL